MNRIKKINKLENIKQKYILLRDYTLFFRNIIENNINIEENKKEKEVVKTLVLTKPYYGKQIKVG